MEMLCTAPRLARAIAGVFPQMRAERGPRRSAAQKGGLGPTVCVAPAEPVHGGAELGGGIIGIHRKICEPP